MSLAGKEVLIKSVAAALLIYTMSCFQLPIQLAKEIEQIIARFWWRDQKTKKGVHWLAWNKVAKRKDYGGLGFKEVLDFNLCNLDSLLAKVLQAKYYPNMSFLEAPMEWGTSWGWKRILQGRKILKVGIRWRVGDGRSIQVVRDPWLPIPRTFWPISRHTEMSLMVADMVSIGGTWKREVIERCFNAHEAHIILSMPPEPVWVF